MRTFNKAESMFSSKQDKSTANKRFFDDDSESFFIVNKAINKVDDREEELFEKIEPLDDIKKKELKETYIKMNKSNNGNALTSDYIYYKKSSSKRNNSYISKNNNASQIVNSYTLNQQQEENIKKLESEIKAKYNMLIPAFIITLKNDAIKLEKEDLQDYFSYYGTIELINIEQNHFYVLYKYYTSCIFAYYSFLDTFKNLDIEVEVKLQQREDHENCSNCLISSSQCSCNKTECELKFKQLVSEFQKNSIKYYNFYNQYDNYGYVYNNVQRNYYNDFQRNVTANTGYNNLNNFCYNYYNNQNYTNHGDFMKPGINANDIPNIQIHKGVYEIKLDLPEFDNDIEDKIKDIEKQYQSLLRLSIEIIYSNSNDCENQIVIIIKTSDIYLFDQTCLCLETLLFDYLIKKELIKTKEEFYSNINMIYTNNV